MEFGVTLWAPLVSSVPPRFAVWPRGLHPVPFIKVFRGQLATTVTGITLNVRTFQAVFVSLTDDKNKLMAAIRVVKCVKEHSQSVPVRFLL
jgi:hypothetical protein